MILFMNKYETLLTLLNNEPELSLDDANSEYQSSLGDVYYKK